MDRDPAITHPPASYATARVLHRPGRDEEIPERLGIAGEAIAALLRLAEAKLARVLAGPA